MNFDPLSELGRVLEVGHTLESRPLYRDDLDSKKYVKALRLNYVFDNAFHTCHTVAFFVINHIDPDFLHDPSHF